MARGWESKSVEMQMEERAGPQVPKGNQREGAELERQRELLTLTRHRLLYELTLATHPRLREQKQKAIDHIDRQISQLQPPR